MIITLNRGSKVGDNQCKVKCDYCGKTSYRTYVLTVRAKRHFCDIDCRTEFEKAIENRPAWKGGQVKMLDYVFLKVVGHPFSNDCGYVKRSRLVMEQYLDRYLTSEETIHHINGIRDDDRLENLMLFANQGEHKTYHYKLNPKYPLICGYGVKELKEIFHVSRQTIYIWLRNPTKNNWMYQQLKKQTQKVKQLAWVTI